jgi:eukaryotic-like serine/threonine-protein kinase
MIEVAEVGTLDGVGHGTVLGGRYRLEERLQSSTSSAYWRAVDQTLERTVGVRVVGGPGAEDALDAARRAAVVEDGRLLRVLDVGTADVGGHHRDGDAAARHITYVVAEFVHARSVAALLQDDGPLPAAQVRTLVGEAAEALEHARAAGLHHRQITPESLLRTHDGKVKVAGLAVDAAAAGVEDEDDVTAARQDAVALVGVLYAGLTGRWPLPGNVRGLEAAPRVAGQAAPPGDLASGVPNDLDTLCAVTLGPHDDGPRTPGELAEELAPWGTVLAEHGVSAAGQRSAASTRPARPARRFPVRLAPEQEQEPEAAQVQPTPDEEHLSTGPGATAVAASGSDSDSDDRPPNAPLSFAQAIGIEEYADPPRGTGNTQKIIIAAIAAVMVIVLILAVRSLASIGGDGEQAAGGSTATVTESPTTATTSGPAPTSAPPAAEPPAIAGVSTLDPQGDDGENDETAPAAVDADPASAWESSTYKTADFGGLKDGVGLVVQLAKPALVSTVTVTANGSGGAFEVRTAPGAGLGGSNVVGTGSVTGQPVAVALNPPVETQFLIIWFTEVPSTDAGYRIELTQVQVQ